MNIVGENFPEKIVKQINVRQEKKGAKNRNPEGNPSLLVWQNSNTGWVKMVSSVDVNSNQRTFDAGTNKFLDNKNSLAQQYVLFGGVYYEGLGKDGLRSGIGRTQSTQIDSAYGLGGLELGLRPMPGITSFSIKSETRGSLRTATIGIKCYNKQQFDIINTLYLSLGYSVLIEWGNAMYYNNDGKFEENNPNSLADEFLSGKLKWNSILDDIQEKRLASSGNYDASLGKVVNFSWTLNRDLSYDVTVIVRTIGDVIESLKMNALSGYIKVNLPNITSSKISSQSGNVSSRASKFQEAAFEKIVKVAAQLGSPDPKITAAIAMNESSWLTSELYIKGNNAFGQTTTEAQANNNTVGITGLIVADGDKIAKYKDLEASVAHHLKLWQRYYVPGNVEKSTQNLVAGRYNTASPQWSSNIIKIYNARKDKPLPETAPAGTGGVINDFTKYFKAQDILIDKYKIDSFSKVKDVANNTEAGKVILNNLKVSASETKEIINQAKIIVENYPRRQVANTILKAINSNPLIANNPTEVTPASVKAFINTYTKNLKPEDILNLKNDVLYILQTKSLYKDLNDSVIFDEKKINPKVLETIIQALKDYIPPPSPSTTTNTTPDPTNPSTETEGEDVSITNVTQPDGATSVETIHKYAYTHDIGALFYQTMILLDGYSSTLTNGSSIDAVKIEFTNNSNPQYYIRLGYFLDILQKNVIYQLKNGKESKIIKFDYDIDSNIILLYSRQLSADPNVCIFQRDYILNDGSRIVIFPELNDFILSGYGDLSKNKPFYGKIMNTYFNMSNILYQMNELKNVDTGVLPLIELLKILTRGFCNSTGNFNKIEPTIDADTNVIRFIDELLLPDVNEIIKQKSNATADFRMYGYYADSNGTTSTAGIVRDLSLTTTVSPKLATMITIGAQANGYITGQDSTALSSMNYGLTDRVKEEWVEPLSTVNYPSPASTTTPPDDAPTTDPPTLKDKYQGVIDIFNRFIQDMATTPGPTWNQDDVSAFSNSIQSFAEYNQAEVTLKQRQKSPFSSSPNIGFLPFDLTLTIDGLSGMKIYQKFIADTSFLPSNYPQSLEFLIKGITHEIKDNQWITRLESLAVPKNPFGAKDNSNLGEPILGKVSPTQNRPTGFTTNTAPSTINLVPSPLATAAQIQAFQTAYNKFWATYSRGSSDCGRYSAKLASIYVKVLRNQPLNLPAGKSLVEEGAGGANAGTRGHIDKIKSFGYTETLIGKNLTSNQMISLFDNPANFGSFSPGDLVTYRSSDGNVFHSMVFTGGYGGSYWTTDVKDNYKSNNAVGFVHKRKSQNSYTAWLLKAPQS
jgi:hypothetical protein